MALSFPVSAPGLQGPPLGLQEIGEVILGQAETSASLANPHTPNQPACAPSPKRHGTPPPPHGTNTNKGSRNKSESLTTKLTIKGASSWISRW